MFQTVDRLISGNHTTDNSFSYLNGEIDEAGTVFEKPKIDSGDLLAYTNPGESWLTWYLAISHYAGYELDYQGQDYPDDHWDKYTIRLKDPKMFEYLEQTGHRLGVVVCHTGKLKSCGMARIIEKPIYYLSCPDATLKDLRRALMWSWINPTLLETQIK